MHEEDDDVIANATSLLIFSADHLVDHLAERLRADGLGRMKPAVDPHHRLALPGEHACLCIGEAFGVRKAGRDVAIVFESLEVRG